MKFYTVHENVACADPDDRIALVREGFIWAAFAVPVLWLVYRRAWLGLALYFAAVSGMLLLLYLGGLPPALMGIFSAAALLGAPAILFFVPSLALMALGLLFAALCGFEAGDIRRLSLARRGYRVVDVVGGRNEVEAELSYFSAHGLPGNVIPPKPGPWGGPGPGGGPKPAEAADQPAARRAGLWAKTSEPILGLFPGADHHG